MTLPPAPEALLELVLCGCVRNCKCARETDCPAQNLASVAISVRIPTTTCGKKEPRTAKATKNLEIMPSKTANFQQENVKM